MSTPNSEIIDLFDNSIPNASTIAAKIISSSTSKLNSKSKFNSEMNLNRFDASENATMLHHRKVIPQSLSKRSSESKIPQVSKNDLINSPSAESIKQNSTDKIVKNVNLSDKKKVSNSSRKLTFNSLANKKVAKNTSGKIISICVFSFVFVCQFFFLVGLFKIVNMNFQKLIIALTKNLQYAMIQLKDSI